MCGFLEWKSESHCKPSTGTCTLENWLNNCYFRFLITIISKTIPFIIHQREISNYMMVTISNNKSGAFFKFYNLLRKKKKKQQQQQQHEYFDSVLEIMSIVIASHKMRPQYARNVNKWKMTELLDPLILCK